MSSESLDSYLIGGNTYSLQAPRHALSMLAEHELGCTNVLVLESNPKGI
jgi:hypothetical protein